MSDIPDRTRAEAQRDIAVPALDRCIQALDADGHGPDFAGGCGLCDAIVDAKNARDRIAEIEKTAPQNGHWVWVADPPEEPE